MAHKIFVYGTLMRGDCRSSALQGQRFAGEARTLPQYRMYDVGSYPALVETPRGVCIEGEVWEVTPACLARLDAVEGVPEGLYERRLIRLQGRFDGLHVEAYLYRQSTDGMQECGTRWHGRSRGLVWDGGPPG